MDAYDVTGAGRRIQAFVDDLSNWYVRRSRRRFWNPGGRGGEDSVAAFQTLHTCLVTTATLLAPFTPFVSEELWSNLAAGRAGRPESVHLADYPQVHEADIDPGLDEAMALARQVVELGRRVRTETRLGTRQPLPRRPCHLRGRDPGSFGDLLEHRGRGVERKAGRLADSAEAFGRWRAKPDFKVLGPRLGRRVQRWPRLRPPLQDDDVELASGSPTVSRWSSPSMTGRRCPIGPRDVALSRDVRSG